MKEKVTIKRGTPQETLMLPLYGRYRANQMYPQLFKDTTAKEIIDRIDDSIEKSDMGKGPQIVYGMRQDVAERKARAFLAWNPEGILVNIGCGLDTIFDHIDNGKCRMVNIDFPEVIEFRRKLFDPKDRETDIGKDANDHAWMDEIGFGPGDKAFIMVLGVLFYFEPDDVRRLVDAIGGVSRVRPWSSTTRTRRCWRGPTGRSGRRATRGPGCPSAWRTPGRRSPPSRTPWNR